MNMKTETPNLKPAAGHSDLPWQVLANPNTHIEDLHPMASIFSGDWDSRKAYIVANSCSPEDAKFICKAVNHHAALVEALKEIHIMAENAQLRGSYMKTALENISSKAQNILATVKGGQS